MAPASDSILWQVKERQGGHWRDFPADLNAVVEEVFQNGVPGAVFPWVSGNGNVTDYEIDFASMVQKNRTTQTTRKVRRVQLMP